MKKTILTLFSLLILFSITGCEVSNTPAVSKINTNILQDTNPEFKDIKEDELRKVTFSEKNCKLAFSGTANETYYTIINQEDIFNYVRMYSDGTTLTFELTDPLIEEWKKYILSIIDNTIETTNLKSDTHVKISNDYKTLYYEGVENGFEFAALFQGCALMQALTMGNEDVSIDVTFKNYHTKNIVWKGKVPEENYKLKDSDWDV